MEKTVIKEENFGRAGEREAKLYTISNGEVSASFTDFGATLVSFRTVGDGSGTETVLGYGSAEGYALGTSYLGATVGRYAGRIGGASFSLDGLSFSLPANDGGNHLHGGFSKRFFDYMSSDCKLVFTLTSPDGDEGFPGNVTLSVTVSLFKSSLALLYEAETDKKTVVNFTNHAYFNLDPNKNSVGSHVLKLYSDFFAEADGNLIPTGMMLLVGNTALDFTGGKPLSGIVSDARFGATRGLDHSFILRGEGLKKAAELTFPETGLTLAVSTTQPTVHVYTGGFLDGDGGPVFRGLINKKSHLGVALETQHLPDSPNKPRFPSTVLSPGEKFSETTVFTLGHL